MAIFFFLIIDQCFAGHQLAHNHYVHTHSGCVSVPFAFAPH